MNSSTNVYYESGFDDDFDQPEEEEIYSVQELSKILKENKKGCSETDKVYEGIRNMKSWSLKRCGSTRPPPRPTVMVSCQVGKYAGVDSPPFVSRIS